MTQKSTGPNDTTSTRYNAVKHGLLAEGVTELDNPEEFRELCLRLDAAFKPVGDIEKFVVKRIALHMVRLNRAARLEAEFITHVLNPPITKSEGGLNAELENAIGRTVVLDPGLPSRLLPSGIDGLAGKFQRYETALDNKFYRALHELDRLQRMRKGETVPPPAVLEVGLHTDEQGGSFGNRGGSTV
jgi:hypothetical protein